MRSRIRRSARPHSVRAQDLCCRELGKPNARDAHLGRKTRRENAGVYPQRTWLFDNRILDFAQNPAMALWPHLV
ncbi:Uncharacterised protein [Afipia felis]|uniref:Uncharacterized protein n=2 Tax=Afipia felis TaxID=1035 RepID=A0A380W754_AFIFE|nr:hypothetical protein HMPREF9697_00201 [Afipia felis ATCC 53690]SUU76382.1 Uncharacterised protein [Afipia felis]SUU84449.1 Uncharacterised protein [Afipia felis]